MCIIGEINTSETIFSNNVTPPTTSMEEKMLRFISLKSRAPYCIENTALHPMHRPMNIEVMKIIKVYDEPTAGLDPVSSTLIEDYIVRLKNELNASCIVVTHQMSTIKRACDNVILLYEGKIVFRGSTEEFLRGDNPYTKQFINASLEGPMEIKSAI